MDWFDLLAVQGTLKEGCAKDNSDMATDIDGPGVPGTWLVLFGPFLLPHSNPDGCLLSAHFRRGNRLRERNWPVPVDCVSQLMETGVPRKSLTVR